MVERLSGTTENIRSPIVQFLHSEGALQAWSGMERVVAAITSGSFRHSFKCVSGIPRN